MTDQTYESLRKRSLTRRSADLGLTRKPGRPVWGVVMETSTDEGVTTLVATDDGSATLLLSTGGGIHLSRDHWPYAAATRLITAAADFMLECAPAWSYPLPDSGMIRFYLLTFDGVLTAEAPPKELASGRSPFSNLFYSAHDVLTLTRLVSEDPDWISYRPSPGGNASTKHILPELAPQQSSVASPATPVTTPAQFALTPEPLNPAPEPPLTAPTMPVTAPAQTAKSDLLLRAAARNDVDEVARLLAEGHDHEPNAKGVTPLMGAAHAGALEPLRLLLAAGAPVDARDDHGYTALMLACNAGHAVCVRLLLGARAEVEAHDNDGMTSLMFAAQGGHDDIVRILMERGADPNAANVRGISAVSLARQKGHEQTVSILLAGYELPRLAQ
jgi:hypothetical protein